MKKKNSFHIINNWMQSDNESVKQKRIFPISYFVDNVRLRFIFFIFFFSVSLKLLKQIILWPTVCSFSFSIWNFPFKIEFDIRYYFGSTFSSFWLQFSQCVVCVIHLLKCEIPVFSSLLFYFVIVLASLCQILTWVDCYWECGVCTVDGFTFIFMFMFIFMILKLKMNF